MTKEEFDKLPICLRYKKPEVDCDRMDSCDFSDYDDPCETCWFWPLYNKERLLLSDYNEVISKIE